MSATTAAHDAAERRAAARALLAHPVLTERTHPDQLAMVRRHATALKSTFASTLGYPLVIESGFARLVKAPPNPDSPTRPARRTGGAEFTPRTYAQLALVCAGLLAPDVGEQVLLSRLVEQLRADAAAAGIPLDDTLAERRSLVAAIEVLVEWGVLTETDGTAAGWGERRAEALLTVTRGLLPQLLARPLHTVSAPAELLADAGSAEQPRRTLRRRLVEDPLVRREDLRDADRDVLSRERTELSRVLAEAFGLVLEVRAEGALAFDPDEELTDVAFPGPGTVPQAALLLLDALIDTLRPDPGSQAARDGRAVPGALAPWPSVADNLEDLARRHARSWRTDLVEDPARLQAKVLDLLGAVGLATPIPDGLLIHPAAARYRPEPTRPPARHRATAPPTQALPTDPPSTLFDPTSQEAR